MIPRHRIWPLLAVGLFATAPAHAADDPAEGPPIRIRISTEPDAAVLECRYGLRVLDLATGRPLGPDPFGPRAIVVVEHAGPRPPSVYRAQVASLSSEDEARLLAEDLGRRLGVPARVHYHQDRRAWRVRLGEGESAGDLDGLVEALADLGYDGIWVTLDAPESERGSLRVVDSKWNDYPAPAPALRIVPARGCERVGLGEASYRGVLEARLDRRGRLTVVNVLPMEQYLRGVVPNELGPLLYPEVEALKAQAVAARTYAWRNLGQFAEDGYDLCDTPRCQVYKGANTEHPLADRAIQETAGVIATHDGKPIHALYSSTCGGHTEDGVRIFAEETGPYLRGVPCYPELDAAARRRWVLSGRKPGPALLDGTGRSAGRDLYLLESLEVLDSRGWSATHARQAATEEEARRWIDATLVAVGKPGGGGDRRAVRSRTDLAAELVSQLGWRGRARMLAAEADLDYLLDFRDAGALGDEDRLNWALLLKDGLLVPFPDGMLGPDEPPARADLARTLARLVRHYGAEGLTGGSLRGAVGDAVRVEIDNEERMLRIRPDLRLVKDLREARYPTARIEVLAGDKIAFRSHIDGGGTEVIDYAEVRPSPQSASDDRFTTVYEWEVRLERDELAERLADRVRGIGRLVDLEPLERGASGRITALKVVGTSGSQVIRGFPIRTALGLRDTQFAIDRQRNADGSIAAFLFTGKGWGHGVGLCQVGAYGMAVRGADYRDILFHYYTDIKLRRVYP